MGSPYRDRPLREKKGPRKVEEDASVRAESRTLLDVPEGAPEFKDGYRECLELFSTHRPNRRGVNRILDEHAVFLEEACVRDPSRVNYARWEGYRACLKELRRVKLVKVKQ